MKKIRSFFQNLKQKISFAKKTSSQEAETEDDFADSFAESPTTEKTGWHEVNPEVFKTSALTQEKEKSFSSVRRKINLQSLPALIFSPRYRGQVHRFFILLLLLVSFYSLGKIIAVFLAQPNTDLKTLALPLL
ncbi:MAG: hypothetical protein KBD63_04725, partial [Bacteriovoracaceae bacterium]|nr:hypothetical protein [Bacteriovoracaceae bacterium]